MWRTPALTAPSFTADDLGQTSVGLPGGIVQDRRRDKPPRLAGGAAAHHVSTERQMSARQIMTVRVGRGKEDLDFRMMCLFMTGARIGASPRSVWLRQWAETRQTLTPLPLCTCTCLVLAEEEK